MRILRNLALALGLFWTLFPYYWAIVSSLKPNEELFRVPVGLVPQHPTLENYKLVLTDRGFLMALGNSCLVCIATVTLALTIGSLAAYALGRMKFRGRQGLLYLVLSMTMFPQIAILGGLYQLVNKLGLFNRLPALTFSYLLFTLPFTVWVLTSFFAQLPEELEEAAVVDGATPMQTFRIIMLPLLTPALATTGLLAFIQCWNEFLYALTFMQTPERYTVTRAIFSFAGKTGSGYEQPWGQMMAATVIVTLPLVVLVLILQNRIIAGLTGGAVKG